MTFFQNSFYELIFPITDQAGQPIASIAKAVLGLRGSQGQEIELSLGDGLVFADSTITATLENTIELSGGYSCELWIETDAGQKHLMRKDSLTFNPTRTRI